MTAHDIELLFSGPDGRYRFSRWVRPIAPVIFGVDDATLPVLKGACEAVVALADHKMAETDPEMGANLMLFFCRDWEELTAVPGLDRIVPGLADLVPQLVERGANQYRVFRFEAEGAIRAACVFLRMDEVLSNMPAEALALDQMVRIILLWSDGTFAQHSPLAMTPDGAIVLRPEIADLIRAGYDPAMPAAANDASHALRLAARLDVGRPENADAAG